MKSFPSIAAILCLFVLAAKASAAQVPDLKSLYIKAGIFDPGLLTMVVQLRIENKHGDAQKAQTPAKAQRLIKEIDTELLSFVPPVQTYMKCSEAVAKESDEHISTDCTDQILNTLDGKIHEAVLQNIRKELGRTELPGTSCTDIQRIACLIDCSDRITCPCCQS